MQEWKFYLNARRSVLSYLKCEFAAQAICTIYNMSGRVVLDIQTQAEGESLYIRYNTDAKKRLIL